MITTQPTISVSNARLCALGALVHALDKGKPMDAAWAEDRHFHSLSPSDRAFSQLLAKTTLRHLGQIDALLSGFLERPLGGKNSRIMHTLRLGVAQLIWLETPPHAAVHSTVELTKQIRMEKYSGLVNAVLKRVSTEGKAVIIRQDAARLNTPAWLWDSWEKAYGKEMTQRIAAAHMREPFLDITVKSNAEQWATTLGGTMLPTGSIRLPEARNITQMEGFSSGDWWVQDAAAAIPARLLGDVQGKNVLDICAAPGGKTAQLVNAGAQVTAIDMAKERVSILKNNLHRLKLEAECITTNALKWNPTTPPDAILLDAPCSATGTLRRHPDVATSRKPEDITRLTATQKKLLHHALDMLTSGKIMVYSTCSLQPEEGENQISALIKERKDVTLLPVNPAMLGGLQDCITPRGEVRTLPCHLESLGGMDGFYAALLKKI